MSAPAYTPPPRFVRLAEADRPAVPLTIDGKACTALAGDTLLVALMCNGRRARDSEFGDGPRAGFCLMGACQDCWVWTPQGERLRACSTAVEADMAVLTTPPATHWPVTEDLAASLQRHGQALPMRPGPTAPTASAASGAQEVSQ
jgi:predicted molibdopterin-dependent oxidoreductase YjgC